MTASSQQYKKWRIVQFGTDGTSHLTAYTGSKKCKTTATKNRPSPTQFLCSGNFVVSKRLENVDLLATNPPRTPECCFDGKELQVLFRRESVRLCYSKADLHPQVQTTAMAAATLNAFPFESKAIQNCFGQASRFSFIVPPCWQDYHVVPRRLAVVCTSHFKGPWSNAEHTGNKPRMPWNDPVLDNVVASMAWPNSWRELAKDWPTSCPQRTARMTATPDRNQTRTWKTKIRNLIVHLNHSWCGRVPIKAENLKA